jgi:nucleoside-diphosphate-sugar epimerase
MTGPGHSRVLVTGATGFVGRALCNQLSAIGHTVIPAVRHGSGLPNEVVTGDIGSSTDWRMALAGCDAVVHLAARVHMMRERSQDPLALYRETNTEAALNLARQAAQAGVKRFVFISTIKVNGEGRDEPYREADAPAPLRMPMRFPSGKPSRACRGSRRKPDWRSSSCVRRWYMDRG